MILTDAGPLVALIHADDRHHEACREAFRSLDAPMVTVWPAFTEAMYLLGFSWQAQDDLWELVGRGVVSFLPMGERDAPRIRELMKRYRDLPMDLADAALVRAAERERMAQIFTVDTKHFRVYRPEGIHTFELIPG